MSFTAVPNSTVKVGSGKIDFVHDTDQATRREHRELQIFVMTASAVNQVADDAVQRKWKRVIIFDYLGKPFKLRVNRSIGQHGGAEIVRQVRGRRAGDGRRTRLDGELVLRVASLIEARRLPRELKDYLDFHLYGLFA